MSDEQEVRRISQRENLDSLYLDLSIVLKWNDEKLLDTNLFELNLWEDLIEEAEVLSKEKSCKVRLGVQTVMLHVEESLHGELNWSVHDELEVNNIYFKVKLHDKNLLLNTIIDGGISFYSLIKYKFPNTDYIEYCLNRLKNITI
jgi:hypothetical protein